MTHIIKDRVRDTSTVVGSGSLTVTGDAPRTYQPFGAVAAPSDTIWIAIVHQTLDEWEVCLATYSGGNSLARTSVLASSNGGGLVNFSAGTKDVIAVQPAAAIFPFEFTSSVKGLVPASGGGTTNFLRADGTFAAPPGSGLSDGDKGDITVSASGATWTIDNDVVTYAKMQNISGASLLLGRGDSGAGDPQEITLGTNLSMSGTTLNASGGGSTNAFGTIVVSGQSDVVADAAPDTLTLVAGSNVTITTNAGSDTITIAAAGGGGTPGGANTNIQFNESSAFGGDNELSWITADKRLLVNHPSATSVTSANTLVPTIQMHGTSTGPGLLGVYEWSNDTAFGGLIIHKSRNATVGSHTVVANGDRLGGVFFAGSDGTVFRIGAEINAIVDATPGSNDMPTRLVFATTADAAGGPTERVWINTAGMHPATNDVGALGTTALGWSDLHLATGAVINWANGEVTITETDANTLTVAGASTVTLGTAAAFTTGTIELGAASDTTLSRSSAGVLAVEGVTVSLNSTSATHTAGTIELGAATDTTLSRSSAGILAVEGVTVSLNSTSATHTAGTIELGNASDTTLSRSAAGVLAVEGVTVVRGGTGSSDNAVLRADGTGGTLAQGQSTANVWIDDSGRLLIGSATSQASTAGGGTATTQIHGLNFGATALNLTRWSNDTGGSFVVLGKSRGTTVGSYTIVQSGDTVGGLSFVSSDGTRTAEGSYIAAVVDATPGSGDTPHRLVFATSPDGQENPTERVRIDNAGRTVIGGTSAQAGGLGLIPRFQVHGPGGATASQLFGAWSADSLGGAFSFVKSRHATIGSHTVVSSGDALGGIYFLGSDGTDFEFAAYIEANVDGTPGNNDMPGRLSFWTTPDGSATAAERMRITQNGSIAIGNTDLSFNGSPTRLGAAADTNVFWLNRSAAFGNNAFSIVNLYTKTRHASDPNGDGTVNNGDSLMEHRVYANDGSGFNIVGYMRFDVSGTVSNGVVPTTFAIANTDSAGLNQQRLFISPGARIELLNTGSTTNAVETRLRLHIGTSGTAAAGLGVGMDFVIEGADGSSQQAGFIDVRWTDAGTDSEDADMVFQLEAAGGAIAEKFRIVSDGTINVNSVKHTASDAGFDVVYGWDDSAATYKSLLLADIATEASPTTGDFVLIYGAEGDLRKVNWNTLPGASGGTNAFGTIVVSGQSDVVADASPDTLTLVAGTNVTITTDAGTDTITISASGGGGAPTSAQYVVMALDGTLSAERVLAVNSTLSLTDGGANGNATLAINLANANTWTAAQIITLGTAATSEPLRLLNTTDNASVQVLELQGDRATPAANDEAYVSLFLSDSAGNQDEFARITWRGVDVTSGSNDARLSFSVAIADSLTAKLRLEGSALTPDASDGTALGTTALMWADLFLASGGVINFNNSNYTITHSAGLLTTNGNLSITTSGVFTAGTIELGAASDTTLARSSAGNVSIEGNVIYRAGGTDVALADGGTGTGLTDPGADRIMAWDDSAGVVKFSALADLNTEGAPAAGDFLLVYVAEDALVKVNWSSLPGAGGGISNVVEDTTPELGGDLESNNFDIKLEQFSADASPAILFFEKSRNASIGSHTVVQSGDSVGAIHFRGSDGDQFHSTASIESFVDGTPGDNDMPGRLAFSVTSDGSSSLTERMRISSTGVVSMGTAISTSITTEFGTTTNGLYISDNVGLALGLRGYNSVPARITNTSTKHASDPGGHNGNFSSNDQLAVWEFYVSDGDTFLFGGGMHWRADGAHADGSVPVSFNLYTSPDSAAPKFRINDAGFVGIGIDNATPARRLVVRDTSGTTNAVVPVARFSFASSSTPATGIGVSIEFETETAADNHEVGGELQLKSTDVGSGTEDFDFVFKLMQNGAAVADKVIFRSNGAVVMGGPLQITGNTTAGFMYSDSSGIVSTAARLIEAEVVLTDGANVTLNAALGNTFKLVAGGNRTIDAPTNKPASGQVQKIVIYHEASGADRTLTLATGSAGAFRFGTSITALTATTSGTVDYIGCIYNDADDRWDVVSYVKGF